MPVPRSETGQPPAVFDTPRPAAAEAPGPAPAGQFVAKAAEPETFVAPLFGLAYLDNPQPDYPLAARRRGVEGRVLVRVKVGRDGRALDVALEQTSGDDLLDRAALRAIGRWRFIPARRGEIAVEAYALVPVLFRLASPQA